MKNNVRSPRSGCPVPPVSPFPKSSLSQRPRTRISGRGGICSLPTGLPGWCVGDFISDRKAETPTFTKDPSRGPLCALNTPLRKKILPSRPRLKRVGGMDIEYLPAGVTTAEGGEEGRDRGKIGTRPP